MVVVMVIPQFVNHPLLHCLVIVMCALVILQSLTPTVNE